MENENKELREQLEVERTQLAVYRERFREAGQRLCDFGGNTDTVDWGTRLDKYMTEVSERGPGEQLLDKTMAPGVGAPMCLTSVLLTDENVKPCCRNQRQLREVAQALGHVASGELKRACHARRRATPQDLPRQTLLGWNVRDLRPCRQADRNLCEQAPPLAAHDDPADQLQTEPREHPDARVDHEEAADIHSV